MTYALAVPFGIAFLELAIWLDLRRDVMRIHGESREALAMLRSAAGDDVKEAAMRGASVRLFAATGMLTLKFLLMAAALLLLYWIVVAVFPEREAALKASFVSPMGVAVLTVATFAYAWARSVVLKKL